jgi:hypothetical protein
MSEPPEPKDWVVALRQPDGTWKAWAHPSGTVYRYTIDGAMASLKGGFFLRWKAGTAKVCRHDMVDALR